MSKKKRKSKLITDPAILAQAKAENGQRKAAQAAHRKSVRQEGWKQAGQGLKELMWSNNVDTLDGAASGALKALGFGDKKTIIKGTLEGIADSHPVKKNLNALGKMVSGAAKGIFNDLSWYNNYPELTQEMIGPNFNVRIGVQDDLQDINTNGTYKPSVASVAGFNCQLVRGSDTNGVIASAMNKLFTSIRQANSGSVNWNTRDLDGYIYNWRTLIAMYVMGCRALRELNRYSIVNKGVPYAVFAAMKLDYDSFSLNAANLRNLLLLIKTRCKSLAIPNLPILQRTEWLFKAAYWDSNDVKHQTYYITTPLVRIYVADSNTMTSAYTASGLNANTTGTSYTTFSTALMNIARNLFDVDKYSIMSGDIVKAYGVPALYQLPNVPTVDEMPIEGFSEEVLTQIQNAWTFTDTNGIMTNSLTSTGAATCLVESITIPCTNQFQVEQGSSAAAKKAYINMYKDHITNLDVIGATRFTMLDDQSLTPSTVVPYAYGTEIFNYISYYNYDYGSANNNYRDVFETTVTSYEVLSITANSTIELTSQAITKWAQFDWAPRVQIAFDRFESGATSATRCEGPVLFDLNVYAKVDTKEQLLAIHDVAVASLYYTPMLVKNSNVVAY